MGKQISMFEAVHKYSVHRFTLMKWFKLGLKYSRTEGGHYKIDEDDIDKFIADKKHLSRHTVLVIDDDVKFLGWMTKALESSGYNALVSDNPIDGLIQMKTFKPNLVILDIAFPKGSGFDIIENLNSDPEIKDTPVLCISGKVDASAILDKCAQIKSVGFLAKPFTPDEMIKKLDEVFTTLTRIS
jgi:CheY-like chemotaxis protein